MLHVSMMCKMVKEINRKQCEPSLSFLKALYIERQLVNVSKKHIFQLSAVQFLKNINLNDLKLLQSSTYSQQELYDVQVWHLVS